MSAAVFLDRDGVLNELVPDPVSGYPESPLDPAEVTLIPGAATAIRRLRGAGFVVVGVSNQPAAAKGIVDLDTLEAVQARVLELLDLEGSRPDAFRLCFHHPDGVVPALTTRCACRKPEPGMLLDAADDLGLELGSSWMVGDTDTDIAAGIAAGCRTILVETAASSHKRSRRARPDGTAVDLTAATNLILHQDGRLARC